MWRDWQLAAILSSTAHCQNIGRRDLPPLLFMTDAERTPAPENVIGGLPEGCAVIFRHYNVSDRKLQAQRCRMRARETGRLFLVAGDYDLAVSVGASGFHCPEHLIDRIPMIRARQPRWLISASVHSRAALMRCAVIKPDIAIAGPVLPTQSHPGRPCIGAPRFADWARSTALPLYALGGIDGKSIMRLRGADAAGIAAITAFLDTTPA